MMVEERCRVTVVVGLVLVVENGSVGGYSWHIGVARRPLTSPCLPLLTVSLRRSPLGFAPSFSVSSFDSSSLLACLTRVSLSLSRAPFRVPSPRLIVVVTAAAATPCESIHTYTHTRPQESAPPSTLSTLCLLVWFRSRSPLPLAIPRSPPSTLPFFLPFHPALPLPPPPRRRCSLLRPAFIPQQNLRDYSSRR